MADLPEVAGGYSVADNILHYRYPSHPISGQRRTRTKTGARNLLEPGWTTCDSCFPKPKPPPKPRRTYRRAAPVPELPPVPEPDPPVTLPDLPEEL